MGQRYDIVRIDFQANAKGANAALESLRSEADKCNDKLTELKKTLKEQEAAGATAKEIENIRTLIAEQQRLYKVYDKGYKELAKGMRTLDEGIKAFNDGTLSQMSAAFQKALNNAARLTRSKLAPDSETYKKDYRELTALMDASQQNYARLQGDAAAMLETLKEGGKVSVSALREEVNAQKELLSVMSETDRGYKRTQKNIAVMESYLRAMGGDYAFVRENVTDTKKVSDDMLRTMYTELEKTNNEGKVTRDIIRDNARAMKEIRAEQERRVESVLGGNLGQQSEQSIRAAIANARELLAAYKTDSREAQTLAAQIVNAEEHLKQYGVEAERTAVREAKAIEEANRKRQESNQLMEDQLRRGSGLTESALKAQEQYWQRLIDDPKAAARELAYYYEQLNKVKKFQQEQKDRNITAGGMSVLQRMRGDVDYESKISEDQRKEDLAALKAYRDSLPKEGNVSILKEIDYYLARLGQTASEAAQATMSLADAEALAGQLGTKGFSASTIQLRQAKKALVEAQQAAGRGTKRFTELQEAINKVDIELAKTGEIAANVQSVLDKPKGKSLNALKQAVEQGRAALANMDRTTKEGQRRFDELAKKVKNADIELKTIGNTAKGTASAFEKAWSRLKTYVTLYVGAAAAMQKLTATMGDLMELSDKMGEVRKTTGFAAEEVGQLSDNLKKLDVRTGITSLMDVSAAAGQLGLKTVEDVEGFTIAANKLMIALPEMGKEAATEMMRVAIATGEVDKIRKQIQEGTVEGDNATAVAMEKIASTIDRLRASSASTAPEITDFVKRLGAVGAQSGITIDQIAAMGSTVSSLGMRVEMSATALSRMIPAIRNNAFQVAKAIKVEPETLRSLFETGRGMEAILMIFQHIKDSGMDEDSIEKLLGMGGMKEVMKELNQQGARAGIVFAGLSQNVDELRSQLATANQAYEENIAIQQEFDRMNETTAAKWERFKNQLEEMFVGDRSQRALGWLIDQLRLLVDIISGNVEPALKSLNIAVWMAVAYFTTWRLGIGKLVTDGFGLLIKALVGTKNAVVALTTTKGLKNLRDNIWILASDTKKYIALKWQLVTAHTAEEKAAVRARLANNALSKSMNANAVMAVVAAVAMLVWKLHEWNEKAKESAREAGRFEAELQRNTKAANKMIDTIGVARVKVEDAEEAVRKARKELEAAKEANDGTAESVKRLEDAETKLLVQEEKKRMAMAEHKRLIEQFNSQYSKYLGFMLSEVSSNLELANARDLVNSKLRETITLKQQEAALGRVEEQMGGKRDERYGTMRQLVYDKIKDPTKAARVMQEIAEASQREYKSLDDLSREILKIASKNKIGGNLQPLLLRAKDYYKELQNIKEAQDNILAQNKAEMDVRRETSQKAFVGQVNAAFSNYNKRLSAYKGAKGDDRARAAAEVLQQMDTLGEMKGSASSYYNMNDPNGEKEYRRQMGQLIAWQGYDRNTLLKEAGKYYAPRKTVSGETTSNIKDTTNSGWGGGHEASSTDWKAMTAEQLVNRRKQMNEFVNAIQDDTDVTRVLKEDPALQKAIENGMSRDVRTVIEWYNTERLKIQDELHARHLTNTGDWMDPKKQRNAHKQFKNEISTYLQELDAYYTERKTRIEEAGTDEGLTDAEIRNRTLANEMEWRQRRAELQKLYARKSGEVTQEEQNAIYHIIAERTEDTEKFVQQTIGKTNSFIDTIEKSGEKGAAIVHNWLAKLGLEVERDYMRQQQALTKQMKAIQDIIDKERPFNGITKNLQQNMATMDILTGDMRDEYNELMKKDADMTEFNKQQAKEELRRISFLLEQAENAYSATIDNVIAKMREKGMTAWADWLQVRPEQQEATMAQLRQTYDAIQDAIKKEASQWKKQAEIMWNNILMPDGKTTLKQVSDKAVAKLGLDENRIKRANSLIGAGQASERVADKLAIKQLQIQLTMQQHYYNLMRERGLATINSLHEEAKLAKERGDIEEATRKTLDAQHAEMTLNLATAKEETEIAKQHEEIIARTEESKNRLYTQLREWGDLLAPSLQSVFEASHAGDAEYYNELAKMSLTGKGGPGAGTYIVIDNEGTKDARAHYEYLDERQALERQHEIERENAQAEAWRKVMDDINMKMSESITDWMNAYVQSQSIDMNTGATELNTIAQETNTSAINSLAETISNVLGVKTGDNGTMENSQGSSLVGGFTDAVSEFAYGKQNYGSGGEISPAAQQQINDSNAVTENFVKNETKKKEASTGTNAQIGESSQSMFAKMVKSANLYGIAYQAMCNDNLDMTQKFEMIALQAVGNAAIAGLEVALKQSTGETAANMPAAASRASAEEGPIVGPILFAVLSALVGGLMGLATSKIATSKSQISQVTGASVSAGRLATGMLTYAEGNVNEFTDPSSLTPGQQYNVDATDGKTYRARYMGKGARTHITNGPEFHLVGEAGREAIIDAHTTRNIQMNDPEIWHTIQTLYNGGRVTSSRVRRGRGVAAFADGNVGDFENAMGGNVAAGRTEGMGMEEMTALRTSLDRQNELWERILAEGIHAKFDVYGPGGLLDSYDTGKKNVTRHGERY